jgi:hypothetical protein
MTELYLAPASKRNKAFEVFQRTVLDGIDRDIYSRHSDCEWSESASLWGLASSFETTWRNINRGDWVLFYTDSDQYEYAAKVVEKEHNSELGDEIQTNLLGLQKSERQDWNYLLVLERPISVSISGHQLANLLNYGNYYPVRFIRVTENRMENLLKEYDSVTEFIQKIRTEGTNNTDTHI